MIRLALLLMMLCLSFAAFAEIVLRTTVSPRQAWVGQRVILQIDVLGDNGWTQISKFGDIDLTGAYLIRTDSQGVRIQDNIDGIAYSGQRYELSIYPQVAGAVEVPEIPVEISTKAWGPSAGSSVQQASIPATHIGVKLPPGAEDVQGLISTTSLTAKQTWEPSIDEAKVGDTLKRTIIVQADDVSAMAFVPLQFTDIPGVGIYPVSPRVKDSTERGTLTGTRTEAVTYVFEQSGEVRIPDIVVSWWNVADDRLERTELPGRSFDVAVGPDGASVASGVSKVRFREFQLPVSILVLLFSAAIYLRRTLMESWSAWLKRRQASEVRYFRLAVKSIRSKKAEMALRDLMRWLDRINTSDRPAQMEFFLSRYGDARLQQAITDLYLSLAKGNEITDVRALQGGLSAARKRWCKNKYTRPRQYDVLPELNHTSQPDPKLQPATTKIVLSSIIR